MELRRVKHFFFNLIIMMLSGLVDLMQYQYLVILILKCYSLGFKVIFYIVIMRTFFLKSKNLLGYENDFQYNFVIYLYKIFKRNTDTYYRMEQIYIFIV